MTPRVDTWNRGCSCPSSICLDKVSQRPNIQGLPLGGQLPTCWACMCCILSQPVQPRVGAALENSPARKQKKSFGSTYTRARKKEATQSHEEQFVPPPKMTISTFDNFAMLTSHPPGFSVRALRGKVGVSYLACASTQKVIPVTKNN